MKDILEDEKLVQKIVEAYPMKENATVAEYEATRRARIEALVAMAKIGYEEYHS